VHFSGRSSFDSLLRLARYADGHVAGEAVTDAILAERKK
jgi:hypothetical protein